MSEKLEASSTQDAARTTAESWYLSPSLVEEARAYWAKRDNACRWLNAYYSAHGFPEMVRPLPSDALPADWPTYRAADADLAGGLGGVRP